MSTPTKPVSYRLGVVGMTKPVCHKPKLTVIVEEAVSLMERTGAWISVRPKENVTDILLLRRANDGLGPCVEAKFERDVYSQKLGKPVWYGDALAHLRSLKRRVIEVEQ